MFNFTTTTIVNAVNNALPVGFSKGAIATGLYLKNVGSFKTSDITIEKKKAVADTPASATLTGITPVAGAIYRLAIDIELYKSESSLYARPWPIKGKPLYAEVIAPSTDATAFCTALVDNATKYMNLVYDTEIVSISNLNSENQASSTITISGKEGSQIFKSIVLEKWVPETGNAVGTTYAGGKWEIVKNATITNGTSGFGTYEHIVHNVVLPTYENMRYGNAVDNAPKLGAMYDQYIITKKVERPDAYGTGAVGQVLTSVTQHVFWVESAVSNTFATLIGTTAPTAPTAGASVIDE